MSRHMPNSLTVKQRFQASQMQQFLNSVSSTLSAHAMSADAQILPWYRHFRQQYCSSSMPITEFEYLQHPVCVVLVATSNDSSSSSSTSLVSTYQKLFDERGTALPSVFADGMLDPSVPRFHLVLHDAQAPHK